VGQRMGFPGDHGCSFGGVGAGKRGHIYLPLRWAGFCRSHLGNQKPQPESARLALELGTGLHRRWFAGAWRKAASLPASLSARLAPDRNRGRCALPGFVCAALPAVLSAHLGTLSLLNPIQWFVILAETGLVIFALPWVVKYGLQLVRAEKWLEAAWVLSIIPSLLTVFTEYTGNAGPTALSRMTAHFLLILKIYAVPLLWLWARERSEAVQNHLLGWGLAASLSGLALFQPANCRHA